MLLTKCNTHRIGSSKTGHSKLQRHSSLTLIIIFVHIENELWCLKINWLIPRTWGSLWCGMEVSESCLQGCSTHLGWWLQVSLCTFLHLKDLKCYSQILCRGFAKIFRFCVILYWWQTDKKNHKKSWSRVARACLFGQNCQMFDYQIR